MSLLSGLLLVLQLVAVLQASPLQDEWEMYKMKHGKVYTTNVEEERRRSIWLGNINVVAEHNKEQNDFMMGINQFSDMTNEEFNNYLGYKMPLEKTTETVNRKIFKDVKTPSKVDYRSEGLVTPAKNQGQCGSCWAFSAIGSMEGAWAKTNGLVSLSEQEMVDCGSGSCNGGWMDEAFKTAISMGGIASESAYPYEAVDYNGCRYNHQAAAHITGYQAVSKGENQLELALVQAGHPISVAIHAGAGLQQYHGGIYSDPSCRYYQLNHGVLLVGYDKTDPNNSYWIVKNSWGSGWGEAGFVNMKMGQNICGISNDPSYATL